MPGIAKSVGRAALPFACIAFAAALVQAQATRTDGSVLAVSADPQDFVFRLDQKGRCGGDWFIMQRTRDNFREVVAVVLTAYSTNRRMQVQVVSCAGDRNIIDHGFSFR